MKVIKKDNNKKKKKRHKMENLSPLACF